MRLAVHHQIHEQHAQYDTDECEPHPQCDVHETSTTQQVRPSHLRAVVSLTKTGRTPDSRAGPVELNARSY
jgi:hypothetical protein